jgi:tubulin-folding cofactor B
MKIMQNEEVFSKGITSYFSDSRIDSVRAFKERMKLGRFSDNEGTDGKKEDISDIIKNIPIGSRCEVTASNAPPKRGVVMFVGNTHFKEGIWVGVKCDEPLGKNDGSIEGKRYFDCQMKYGVFVKPSSVKVGDFPEESISDDEI